MRTRSGRARSHRMRRKKHDSNADSPACLPTTSTSVPHSFRASPYISAVGIYIFISVRATTESSLLASQQLAMNRIELAGPESDCLYICSYRVIYLYVHDLVPAIIDLFRDFHLSNAQHFSALRSIRRQVRALRDGVYIPDKGSSLFVRQQVLRACTSTHRVTMGIGDCDGTITVRAEALQPPRAAIEARTSHDYSG